MKFIKPLFAIMITAFMLSICVCYADMLDVEKIENIYKDVGQRNRNLWGITKSIHQREDIINGLLIVTYASELMGGINPLVSLSLLQPEMVNAKDKSAVKRYLDDELVLFKGNCAIFIPSINSDIASLKNPEMMSESQSLRDDVVKACDIVQHWK